MLIARSLDGLMNSVAYAADGYSTGLSAVQSVTLADAAGMVGAVPEKDPPAEPVKATNESNSQDDDPPVINDAGQDVPAEGPGDGEPAAQLSDEEVGPGEDDKPTEDDDPADEQPPIDPPRSWSKEDKENWAQLPRETQERLADRERSRETDFLRRQNEFTEARKAAQAEAQQAQQARDQYKDGVDQLAAQAAAFVNSEFADIKTMDDVRQMAREDPTRYSEYDAATKQAQAIQAVQQRLAGEQRQEAQQRFANYAAEETEKFREQAPEFFDPKTAPQLESEVRSMLVDDYRLSDQELQQMVQGAPMHFQDHRMRLLIRDALAYKKAKAKAQTKPNRPKPKSPPPQRPGSPPAKGEARNRALDQASKRLDREGSRDAALALMRARGS